MKKNYVDLKESNFIGNKLKKLPNGIIDKTYTSIGATTLEILYERDSIIIAPLKSIAYCKKQKHPEIIVVNGDKDIEYLANSIRKVRKRRGFVKIISTPESVWKVQCALTKIQEDISDYFYLIDEFHMFQTESGYRNHMGRAVEIYFNQPEHNRSFITATWIPTCDSRFDNEAFTKIKPNKPKVCINVIETNCLSKAIAEVWKDEKFIFINSVVGAKTIEAALGFDCNIYCSDNKNSRDTAGSSYSKFNDELSKVNIFTSAYFAGYDIDASGNVIIAVNGYSEHTMINPFTLYQIIGRIRGSIGRIVLIVVLNNKYKTNMTRNKLKEELLSLAKTQKESWNLLLQNGLITEDSKDGWEEWLETTGEYKARLTRESNNTDLIEIDNQAIDGLLLKYDNYEIYSDIKNLINSINSTEQMSAKYLGYWKTEGLGEYELNLIKELRAKPRREAFEYFIKVAEAGDLGGLNKILTDMTLDEYEKSNSDYNILLAKYYALNGLESLKDTDGDIRKIKRGITKALNQKMAQKGYVLFKMRLAFENMTWISQKDCREKIAKVFKDCGVDRKATSTVIMEYFNAQPSDKYVNGHKTHGYTINGPFS